MGDPPSPEQPAHDFAQVVKDHWSAVYRFFYHSAGQVHDADEMTQETFLRAWKSWPSFKTGTHVRAWLLRIANNLFTDLVRRRQRLKFSPLADDLPEKVESVGHHLEVRDLVQRLQIALEELSETARTVFHLRSAEDLSFREIAQIVGISEESARWHMHQARTKLFKHMDEET